ncbi:MAG: hypothetical protein COA43_11170 [Robiginitomaculum sp.]|nr:MAG: hypothetical protein COA43_11170 [Robiginitomaculum sp.]
MEVASLDVQKAFLSKLSADADLQQLMGGEVRVDETTPDNAVFPYIQIGDDQTIDNSNTCAKGSEIYAQVHIWSRHEKGKVEAKKMGARIRDLLNTKLSLADHYITVHEFQNGNYFDTQNKTETHGVLTFRYLLYEK